MRLWFIEIGEPLPLEAGKRLLRYGCFSAWLARRGHDVTWFACDFSHAVKNHVCAPGEYALETGVRLSVTHGPGYAKNVCPARFWHNIVFAWRLHGVLKKMILAQGAPDLIIAPIPTVENAFVAARMAEKNNTPLILDVRDNWPDDLVNRVPSPLRPVARIAFSFLFSMARHAARGAASITGVTRLQRAYGLALAGRAADETRDPVFYLGYTRKPVSPEARAQADAWWRAQGLNETAKIFCFTGTIGISFDFAPVIEAANRLRASNRTDIQFVIAGDGDSRAHWVKKAGTLAGSTILFPGWIDQPRIDSLLARSRAALAPYIPDTTMSLPNKFFEYMAYGLPVLSSCSGESSALLRENNIGLQYDPHDANTFHDGVLRLADDIAFARSQGEAALAVFKARFAQDDLFAAMERHFETLTNTPRSRDAAA